MACVISARQPPCVEKGSSERTRFIRQSCSQTPSRIQKVDPRFWTPILIWCRLWNPKLDLLFGSAQGSGSVPQPRPISLEALGLNESRGYAQQKALPPDFKYQLMEIINIAIRPTGGFPKIRGRPCFWESLRGPRIRIILISSPTSRDLRPHGAKLRAERRLATLRHVLQLEALKVAGSHRQNLRQQLLTA